MLTIISALEREDSLTSLQIARAIGVCVPDVAEATRILHYITYFGKIESNPEGNWRIIKKEEDSDPPPKKFRVKYIQNLMKIIDVLNEGTQSAEELAQRTSQEIDSVQEILSFLSLTTGKGYIHLQGSGHPQQWSLRPWLSSSPRDLA